MRSILYKKNQLQLVLRTSNSFYKNFFKQVFIFLLKKNKLSNLFFREISLKKKKKKFTLLKSPHVFKDARVQLEFQQEVFVFFISNFTFHELKKIIYVIRFLMKFLPVQTSLKLKNKFFKNLM